MDRGTHRHTPPRVLALLLVLAISGCGGGESAGDQGGRASDFEVGVRGLDIGDLQDEVRRVVGEPADIRQWAVTVPWWGPGENLASELPQGSPVETWSYRREGQVYYLHFDSAKAGKPLLGIEVYPEGAIF